jgi:hypothetical protein
MSLETQISELSENIKMLNATMLLLLNQQKTPIEPTPTPEPVQATIEQTSFIPESAKAAPTITREELKTFCLNASRDNDGNKAAIKSILQNHFDIRKVTDLADNQIMIAYDLIKQAVQND